MYTQSLLYLYVVVSRCRHSPLTCGHFALSIFCAISYNTGSTLYHAGKGTLRLDDLDVDTVPSYIGTGHSSHLANSVTTLTQPSIVYVKYS